jgi:hypothetical protein
MVADATGLVPAVLAGTTGLFAAALTRLSAAMARSACPARQTITRSRPCRVAIRGGTCAVGSLSPGGLDLRASCALGLLSCGLHDLHLWVSYPLRSLPSSSCGSSSPASWMICANLQTNGQLAQASHGRRVREQSIAGLDLAGLLSRKFRHQRDVFGSCDPLGPSGLTPKLLVLTEGVHGGPVDRHGFAIQLCHR